MAPGVGVIPITPRHAASEFTSTPVVRVGLEFAYRGPSATDNWRCTLYANARTGSLDRVVYAVTDHATTPAVALQPSYDGDLVVR
jgi:hypothetical protein